MTTNHPNDSINHTPLLSQEMERTLRRLAWKDEDFREALIADPKEIIQQVFPHCFPNGKLPNDLTINIVEEDAYTHHIVLPLLADETPALEIPEEQQLDLLVNLGELGKFNNDHAEARREKSTSQKADFTRQQFNNKENQAPKQQEYTSERTSKRAKFDAALHQMASQDGTFQKQLRANPREAIKEHFPEYLPNGKLLDGHTFKVIQNTADTHHIVLGKLSDAAQHPGVSEKELSEHADNMPKKRDYTDPCSDTKNCHTTDCPSMDCNTIDLHIEN